MSSVKILFFLLICLCCLLQTSESKKSKSKKTDQHINDHDLADDAKNTETKFKDNRKKIDSQTDNKIGSNKKSKNKKDSGKKKDDQVKRADKKTGKPKRNNEQDKPERKSKKSFYSFTVTDFDGKEHSLEKYKGKISLVVNVASECGYTDNHYKALKKIYNHLSPTGKFTVLAFPCNQFGRQEPASDKEIQDFVKSSYQVKFPVFKKINVIDEDVPDVWKFLIEQSGTAPTWNFFKYLVNENGDVLNSWGPWVSVDEIYPVVNEAVKNIMGVRHTEL